MIYRPVDENGDVLPVLSSSCMFREEAAVAQYVKDRLSMLSGDWWENPSWGNEVLDMLTESRITESDQQAIASYLSAYIRETTGVQDVRDETVDIVDRKLHYSCWIETENGSIQVNYEI